MFNLFFSFSRQFSAIIWWIRISLCQGTLEIPYVLAPVPGRNSKFNLISVYTCVHFRRVIEWPCRHSLQPIVPIGTTIRIWWSYAFAQLVISCLPLGSRHESTHRRFECSVQHTHLWMKMLCICASIWQSNIDITSIRLISYANACSPLNHSHQMPT